MADRSGRAPEYVSTSRPARSRVGHFLLAACALVGTVQRIAILRLEPKELLARYGSDDMFYYTEIARHFAIGRALSFDGVHATSGAQPLWLALLAPWASLFEGRPELAFRIDLALVTVLTLVSGLIMPRVVRAVMSRERSEAEVGESGVRAIGTLAGCVWFVHPRVLSVTFEGTEGALAALCWQLSAMAWAKERSAVGSFRLGVALGMGALARVDHFALAGAFLVWPRSQRRPLRRAALVISPVVALWGSWLAFCRLTTGSFVQDSGAAKRIAHERGDAIAPSRSAGGWSAISYAPERLAKGISASVHIVFYTGSHLSRFSALAAFVLMLALAIAIGRRVRQSAGAKISARSLLETLLRATPATAFVCRTFGPLFLAAGGVLFAYFFALGHLRTWYAMPAQLSITLLGSALSVDLARNMGPAFDLGERPLWLALTCTVWLTGAWTEPILSRTPSWYASYYAAAKRLVAVTPASSRIGAFNAGIFGAFASEGSRRVINLDGVVNHSALLAIESRTLTDYILDERIDFIADYSGAIPVEEKIAAPGLQAQLELVETVPLEERPGEVLGIWRVRPRH